MCIRDRVYISAENLWCWAPLYKHTRDLDVTNIYGSDPDPVSYTHLEAPQTFIDIDCTFGGVEIYLPSD